MTGSTQKPANNFRMFAVMMILLLGVSLTVSGCDWFDDDDDDVSATSGSATGPGPTSIAGTSDINGTGIVWKPISEGDTKLVVLTPTSYGNPGASIYSFTDGTMIEDGRYYWHSESMRASYRFSRQGGGYPSPCTLKIGVTYFYIPVSSARYN